jgi:hypothetical protein
VSIPDTATKQDDTVDPDLVEELCQGIAAYLGKRAHRNEGSKRKK